jgi:hypothetical protein
MKHNRLKRALQPQTRQFPPNIARISFVHVRDHVDAYDHCQKALTA